MDINAELRRCFHFARQQQDQLVYNKCKFIEFTMAFIFKFRFLNIVANFIKFVDFVMPIKIKEIVILSKLFLGVLKLIFFKLFFSEWGER